MPYNIYLFLSGNCSDAFEFYAEAIDGEITERRTYANAPPGVEGALKETEKIMHIVLQFADGVIMGSDDGNGSSIGPNSKSNFAIALSPKSKRDADAIFAKLSDSGTVIVALEHTFWGGYFGHCIDRYGVGWMVNVD
jgi:PhnB protein